jgi:hypothetical protein
LKEEDGMAKFCENGHQMDESWPECPYCKRVGYRDASTQNAGKTRPNLGNFSRAVNCVGSTLVLTTEGRSSSRFREVSLYSLSSPREMRDLE